MATAREEGHRGPEVGRPKGHLPAHPIEKATTKSDAATGAGNGIWSIPADVVTAKRGRSVEQDRGHSDGSDSIPTKRVKHCVEKRAVVRETTITVSTTTTRKVHASTTCRTENVGTGTLPSKPPAGEVGATSVIPEKRKAAERPMAIFHFCLVCGKDVGLMATSRRYQHVRRCVDAFLETSSTESLCSQREKALSVLHFCPFCKVDVRERKTAVVPALQEHLADCSGVTDHTLDQLISFVDSLISDDLQSLAERALVAVQPAAPVVLAPRSAKPKAAEPVLLASESAAPIAIPPRSAQPEDGDAPVKPGHVMEQVWIVVDSDSEERWVPRIHREPVKSTAKAAKAPKSIPKPELKVPRQIRDLVGASRSRTASPQPDAKVAAAKAATSRRKSLARVVVELESKVTKRKTKKMKVLPIEFHFRLSKLEGRQRKKKEIPEVTIQEVNVARQLVEQKACGVLGLRSSDVEQYKQQKIHEFLNNPTNKATNVVPQDDPPASEIVNIVPLWALAAAHPNDQRLRSTDLFDECDYGMQPSQNLLAPRVAPMQFTQEENKLAKETEGHILAVMAVYDSEARERERQLEKDIVDLRKRHGKWLKEHMNKKNLEIEEIRKKAHARSTGIQDGRSEYASAKTRTSDNTEALPGPADASDEPANVEPAPKYSISRLQAESLFEHRPQLVIVAPVQERWEAHAMAPEPVREEQMNDAVPDYEQDALIPNDIGHEPQEMEPPKLALEDLLPNSIGAAGRAALPSLDVAPMELDADERAKSPELVDSQYNRRCQRTSHPVGSVNDSNVFSSPRSHCGDVVLESTSTVASPLRAQVNIHRASKSRHDDDQNVSYAVGQEEGAPSPINIYPNEGHPADQNTIPSQSPQDDEIIVLDEDDTYHDHLDNGFVDDAYDDHLDDAIIDDGYLEYDGNDVWNDNGEVSPQIALQEASQQHQSSQSASAILLSKEPTQMIENSSPGKTSTLVTSSHAVKPSLTTRADPTSPVARSIDPSDWPLCEHLQHLQYHSNHHDNVNNNNPHSASSSSSSRPPLTHHPQSPVIVLDDDPNHIDDSYPIDVDQGILAYEGADECEGDDVAYVSDTSDPVAGIPEPPRSQGELDDDNADDTLDNENDMPVTDKLFAYIQGQTHLYSRILRYEPLDFESLHSQIVQTKGLAKCSRKALAAFLDSKAINYVLPTKPAKLGQNNRRRWR
ncbi:hypothetical protein DFJ77DRAFT_176 [Powellomyces hirtus]|nr:hypothetical protein DFJ77DRAFT_176 [Powellomyces hirtus]